jgi:uncharacterized membrane protein
MINNLSYLEIFWITVLFIGIGASLWMTAQAYLDLRARRISGKNGLLLMRVRNDMRVELIRLSVLICLVWYAYRATLSPVTDIHWNINTAIFVVIFIWIPLALGYDAIRSAQTRKKITRAFEEST